MPVVKMLKRLDFEPKIKFFKVPYIKNEKRGRLLTPPSFFMHKL